MKEKTLVRLVDVKEIKQRGCPICADAIALKGPNCHGSGAPSSKSYGCPYSECPYHELDNIKSYQEYEHKYRKNPPGDLIEAFAKRMQESIELEKKIEEARADNYI